MKLLDRLTSLLGIDLNNAPRPELVELRTVVDEGRQRKRTEMYDEALNLFDQALAQAQTLRDTNSTVIIQLHRADVLIQQARWQDADSLLRDLESEARRKNEPTYLAYALTTSGTLHQAQGDLLAARQAYEHGLEAARAGHSAGAEGRALGHLGDIYLLDGNASYASRLLRDSLDKLNTSNDVELSSYFVGRLGEALIATGHESEGDQLIGRALRLAQHLNYRPFERRWHLALAQRAVRNAHYGEAFKHYERVLVMLRGDAPEVPGVLRELGKTCLNLNRYDDALQYLQRGLALQPDDPRMQGAYGLVLHAGGQSAEALPWLEKAVTYGLEHPYPDHLEDLRTYAGALVETGSATEALNHYDQALKLARRQQAPLEEARVQRDRGTYFIRQRQTQAAIKAWSDAVQLYEGQGMHTQVARLECDIASLRMYQGQGQRAMKDYEHALMVLSSVQDQETRGIVLANAATAYVDQGDIETAESFLTEAIKIAQKLHDKAAEATRRGNYGWLMLATGRAQRSLNALDYACRLSETLNLTLPLAVQTNNIGLAHGELDQPDLALEHHRKALTLATEANSDHWIAIIRLSLAMQLLQMRQSADLTEAAALIDAAKLAGEALDSYEIHLRVLIAQATLALRQDQVETAVRIAQEAVLLARRGNVRRLLADALTTHSEALARTGDPAKAQTTWDEARRLLEVLNHPLAKITPVWLDFDHPGQPYHMKDQPDAG